MKKIKLKNCDKYAIVSDEDYDRLNQYEWSFNRYARRQMWLEPGVHKNIFMHKEILCKKGFQTDHINGDELDNRRENLRLATNRQNSQNRKYIRNKHGYKGVCLYRSRNKYIAYITVDGKRKSLGYFNTIEEAAKAYNVEALKYFGEFAHLNVIPEIRKDLEYN